MSDSGERASSAFEDLTADLRALKRAAGDPAYAELVRRVERQRMARGASRFEARIGRTTVYDAFRPGRRMLDPTLVGDLVQALGGSPSEVAALVERCEQARLAARASRDAQDAPAPGATRQARLQLPGDLPGFEFCSRLSSRAKLALLLSGLALNLAGRVLVLTTHLPLYLDMVGTAFVAIVLGPWWGASVGAITSVSGAGIDGWISIPFAPVEVVGALLWGYGVRRLRLGRSVPRFFLLNVIVAACCTLVAVPILVWVAHGTTGDGADAITRTMVSVWHNLLAAVALQNIMTSIIDKTLSGFFALSVAEALATRLGGQALRAELRSAWLRVRSLPQPDAAA